MCECASPRHASQRQRIEYNPVGFARTRQSLEFTFHQAPINPYDQLARSG
jgi:hypothetical protein